MLYSHIILAPFTSAVTAELTMVPPEASLQLHELVFQVGYYFMREMTPKNELVNYFVKPQPELQQVGWLFAQPCPTEYGEMGALIFGGCKFSWLQERWRMRWVWIHPFERRRGILARNWKRLEEQHGADFDLEGPASPAMEQFLRIHGAGHQVIEPPT